MLFTCPNSLRSQCKQTWWETGCEGIDQRGNSPSWESQPPNYSHWSVCMGASSFPSPASQIMMRCSVFSCWRKAGSPSHIVQSHAKYSQSCLCADTAGSKSLRLTESGFSCMSCLENSLRYTLTKNFVHYRSYFVTRCNFIFIMVDWERRHIHKAWWGVASTRVMLHFQGS